MDKRIEWNCKKINRKRTLINSYQILSIMQGYTKLGMFFFAEPIKKSRLIQFLQSHILVVAYNYKLLCLKNLNNIIKLNHTLN